MQMSLVQRAIFYCTQMVQRSKSFMYSDYLIDLYVGLSIIYSLQGLHGIVNYKQYSGQTD